MNLLRRSVRKVGFCTINFNDNAKAKNLSFTISLYDARYHHK